MPPTALAEFSGADDRFAEVRLVLDVPPDAHGIVIDPTGAPVPGATVTCMDGEASTLSQENGAFLVRNVRFMSRSSFAPGLIRAHKQGWTTLMVSKPSRATKTGLWRAVEIVMARDGQLSVHVVDSQGQGAAGEEVQLCVSPQEPFAPVDHDPTTFEAPVLHGETDQSGLVRLEGVPTECRLQISVAGTAYELQRLDGSLLLAGEARRVDMIRSVVIGTARPAAFILRRGAHWVATGLVLELDGSASANARVSLYMLDSPDALGREHLLVVAQSVNGELPPRHMSSGIRYPDPIASAMRAIHVRESDRIELELRLAPLPNISGRVIDHEGLPVAGVELRLLSPGMKEGPDLLRSGRAATTKSRHDGTFRFKGVTSETFDLACHGEASGSLVLHAVKAGDLDLEVRLDKPQASAPQELAATPRNRKIRQRLQARRQASHAGTSFLRGQRTAEGVRWDRDNCLTIIGAERAASTPPGPRTDPACRCYQPQAGSLVLERCADRVREVAA